MNVTPNCRYGHGDLMRASDHGVDPRWGFASLDFPAQLFTGQLFVCPTCGYTEFFDDDPKLTVEMIKPLEEPK